MADSREIVRRTLSFDDPPRVARSFHDSDIVFCRSTTKTQATDWQRVGDDRWERIDEWGNLWRRCDATSLGEVAEGVLASIEDIDRYEFPDYSRPADYEDARRQREATPDKWLLGELPGFAFGVARKMFRLDEYLCNLMTHRERIHLLHDKIDAQIENLIRNYADAGVDGIIFWEDWGTQTQTLVSPGLWSDEFRPRFVRLCRLAHDCGLRVFMHSCGAVGAVVPGLIDAGVDVLQFDQPRLHGIDTLASYQENADITFWCPVDIQKTMQTGDETTIRREAVEMLDKLWKGRGGFIAGYYEDLDSIGIDRRWQDAACAEFAGTGIRARYA